MDSYTFLTSKVYNRILALVKCFLFDWFSFEGAGAAWTFPPQRRGIFSIARPMRARKGSSTELWAGEWMK